MTTEIEGLRERRMARTRSRIVDVAIDLFEERGYDAVTVNDICLQAEVAPRTFFRYFPAKEDVLADVVRDMADQVEGSISAAPAELSDVECVRSAMLELGAYVVGDQDRLIRFFRVATQASTLRSHPFTRLADREAGLVAQLALRHPDDPPPGWRTRLLAATHSAAFRVWLDDLVDGTGGDPLAHLREILAAT